MVRVVSEEAFNEVVQENITEFGMTREEAIEDAKKQFVAQGVELNHLVKITASDIVPTTDKEAIDYCIAKLEIYTLQEEFNPSILSEMEFLRGECEKGLGHKIYIGNKDIVDMANILFEKYFDNRDMRYSVFETLTVLMTDQPDLMDETMIKHVTAFLDKERDVECLIFLLKWMKVSCIKHEKNRQDFVAAGVIPILKEILDRHKYKSPVVRGVCAAFRVLALDDDIRAEFGLAHEHARVIADLSLSTIVELLKIHESDKDSVAELLLLLCAVVVRNEYCEKVVEADGARGLKHILDTFQNFPSSEKLNRQCMKLLKVLAGSDVVKSLIVKAGAAPLIVYSMTKHQRSSELTAAGNGCIAALTLRCPTNSENFGHCDVAAVILDGMRAHPQDLNVVKQGCWAIRNIVSRNRELCPLFLQNGAEELLNFVLEAFGDECSYDAKSALRDLGCEVNFKEEWTGKGGALN